jgi:hypothetical protein
MGREEHGKERMGLGRCEFCMLHLALKDLTPQRTDLTIFLKNKLVNGGSRTRGAYDYNVLRHLMGEFDCRIAVIVDKQGRYSNRRRELITSKRCVHEAAMG